MGNNTEDRGEELDLDFSTGTINALQNGGFTLPILERDIAKLPVRKIHKFKGIGVRRLNEILGIMFNRGYEIDAKTGKLVKGWEKEKIEAIAILDRIEEYLRPTIDALISERASEAIDKAARKAGEQIKSFTVDDVSERVFDQLMPKVIEQTRVKLDVAINAAEANNAAAIAAVKEGNKTINRGNKLMDAVDLRLRHALTEIERTREEIELAKDARANDIRELKLSLFDNIIGKKAAF